MIMKNSLTKSKNKGVFLREKKMSRDQRKQRVTAKIQQIVASLQ